MSRPTFETYYCSRENPIWNDVQKSLLFDTIYESDKEFREMMEQLIRFSKLDWEKAYQVVCHADGTSTWVRRSEEADSDDYACLKRQSRMLLSKLVLLDADIAPLSRLEEWQEEQNRPKIVRRNERFLLAAEECCTKTGIPNAEEVEFDKGLSDYLVYPLEYIAWRQRPDSSLPIEIMPLPDEFISFAASVKEATTVPETQSSETSVAAPPTRQGRAEKALVYVKMMQRALQGAIWLLVRERAKYVEAGTINAALLANAIVTEKSRIWKRDVKLPGTKTIADRISDSARLHIPGRHLRPERKHPESHDVQFEYLLMSAIWCIVRNPDVCIVNGRLKADKIPPMISEYESVIWCKGEYRRGLHEDEAKMLQKVFDWITG